MNLWRHRLTAPGLRSRARKSPITIASISRAVGRGVTVMPVVKADAYRHGAIEISRVLVETGAEWLAVSNVEEGVALRIAGINTRILVMADFLPVGRLALCEHNLTPVIHAIEDLKDLNEPRMRPG